jgi:hypothetical protein
MFPQTLVTLTKESQFGRAVTGLSFTHAVMLSTVSVIARLLANRLNHTRLAAMSGRAMMVVGKFGNVMHEGHKAWMQEKNCDTVRYFILAWR